MMESCSPSLCFSCMHKQIAQGSNLDWGAAGFSSIGTEALRGKAVGFGGGLYGVFVGGINSVNVGSGVMEGTIAG